MTVFRKFLELLQHIHAESFDSQDTKRDINVWDKRPAIVLMMLNLDFGSLNMFVLLKRRVLLKDTEMDRLGLIKKSFLLRL